MDALVLAHLAPWAPESSLVAHVNSSINDWPAHAAGCYLLSVVQAATYNWASLNPALANGHRLKRTLCLPETLLWNALVDLCELTSHWAQIWTQDLWWPDSHAGHAHCSTVVFPNEPQRQVSLQVCFYYHASVTAGDIFLLELQLSSWTFRICGQWLWDYAIKFTRWQHLQYSEVCCALHHLLFLCFYVIYSNYRRAPSCHSV